MGNIPVAVSSFVGRAREVDEVRMLLRRVRLLTLTGPGGVGKSRLALEVSRQDEAGYAHGAWVVELASLTDEAMLAGAVAGVLGVRDESGTWLTTALVRFLRPLTLLLVLDDCEHLVDACATLVDGLLRGAADLRILATSREPLGIVGEHVWQVPPLSTDEAVQLFIERGEAVGVTHLWDGPARTAISQLCERVDRLPLGAEAMRLLQRPPPEPRRP